MLTKKDKQVLDCQWREEQAEVDCKAITGGIGMKMITDHVSEEDAMQLDKETLGMNPLEKIAHIYERGIQEGMIKEREGQN